MNQNKGRQNTNKNESEEVDFDDVGEGAVRNYFKAGRGVARVERLKIKTAAESFHKTESFIAEFEIVEHTPRNEGGPQMVPGELASWVIKPHKQWKEYYPRDQKALLSAIDNVPFKSITKQIRDYAISDENPNAGKLVRFVATPLDGEPDDGFCKVTFRPYTEGAAEGDESDAA